MKKNEMAKLFDEVGKAAIRINGTGEIVVRGKRTEIDAHHVAIGMASGLAFASMLANGDIGPESDESAIQTARNLVKAAIEAEADSIACAVEG